MAFDKRVVVQDAALFTDDMRVVKLSEARGKWSKRL